VYIGTPKQPRKGEVSAEAETVNGCGCGDVDGPQVNTAVMIGTVAISNNQPDHGVIWSSQWTGLRRSYASVAATMAMSQDI